MIAAAATTPSKVSAPSPAATSISAPTRTPNKSKAVSTPKSPLRQAQADRDAIGASIAAQTPESNKGWGVFVEPRQDDFIPKDRIQTLWLLLGGVGFVRRIFSLHQ